VDARAGLDEVEKRKFLTLPVLELRPLGGPALERHYRVVNPSKTESRVTSRLAVYSQSVHLGGKPLEACDQKFIFQLSPCVHSPYVTSSLTSEWSCHL
jgi:hypothetical protein